MTVQLHFLKKEKNKYYSLYISWYVPSGSGLLNYFLIIVAVSLGVSLVIDLGDAWDLGTG